MNRSPLREFRLTDEAPDGVGKTGASRSNASPRGGEQAPHNSGYSGATSSAAPVHYYPQPMQLAQLVPTQPAHPQLAPQLLLPHPGLSAAGVAPAPLPQQPASLTLTLPSAPRADPEQLARSFLEVQGLQEAWEHASGRADEGPEQVKARLRALVHDTTRAASRAAQAPQSSALLLHLLEGRAAEVLEARGEGALGARLAELAEVLARQDAGQGGALIKNIVSNTSRQALAGGPQVVKAAAVNAQKTSQRTDTRTRVAARSAAWLRQHQDGLKGALLAGGALLAVRLLGGLLGPTHDADSRAAFLGPAARWRRGGRGRGAEALDRRRRVLCEVANAQARAYAAELHEHRFNPFYRRPPPQDLCQLEQAGDHPAWRSHRLEPHY